jgi:hypothetical protein
MYAVYALKFKWTPRQVDEEIPADVAPYFLEVVEIIERKRNA